MKARVFSGIQPTGSPHIGNYLGALKNWAKIQYDYESIYCIVDLHAVTIYQDPAELRSEDRRAGRNAAGDRHRSDAFRADRAVVDSRACGTGLDADLRHAGRLAGADDAVQGKVRRQETIGDGLLQYPVLMAADILLYNAAIVPVGDDQIAAPGTDARHRSALQFAVRRNFRRCRRRICRRSARASWDSMSRKENEQVGTGSGHAVSLLDPPEVIRKKIMRATTDSNPAVDFDNMGAGVANLLTIFQAFTGWPADESRRISKECAMAI